MRGCHGDGLHPPRRNATLVHTLILILSRIVAVLCIFRQRIFRTRMTLLFCAKSRIVRVFDECVLFPIFRLNHLILSPICNSIDMCMHSKPQRIEREKKTIREIFVLFCLAASFLRFLRVSELVVLLFCVCMCVFLVCCCFFFFF